MSNTLKTAKFRIAVAVDADGNIGISQVWDNNTSEAIAEAIAEAQDVLEDGGPTSVYIVTADLPLPVVPKIAGTVTEASDE